MTKQLDTVITQLTTIQATIATLPTFPELENALTPINASIRYLLQSVSAVPQAPQTLVQPVVPPTGAVAHSTPQPPPPQDN